MATDTAVHTRSARTRSHRLLNQISGLFPLPKIPAGGRLHASVSVSLSGWGRLPCFGFSFQFGWKPLPTHPHAGAGGPGDHWELARRRGGSSGESPFSLPSTSCAAIAPPWGCPETPASQPLCGGQRGDKIQLPPYLGNGGGGWGCPRFRPISFQMLLLSFRIPGFGSWGEPSPLLSPAPALLFALLSPPPPPFPCQARQGLWPKPYGLSRVDNMLQFSLRQ